MIEIIRGSGRRFKEHLGEFLAANPEAELIFIESRGPEGGKGFHAIYQTQNGISEVAKDKTKLDETLLKENVDLNKALDTKKKEFVTLQAHFSDMQDKLGDAVAEATKCKEDKDKLEELIGEKEAEIAELKKENTTLKGQNTKLKKKIADFIEE